MRECALSVIHYYYCTLALYCLVLEAIFNHFI